MDKCTVPEDITIRLKKIISNITPVDMEIFGQGWKDKKLLGNRINFSARDLLYLYFEVQKEFDIKIPQTAIISETFDSFQNISEMILDQICLKEKAV